MKNYSLRCESTNPKHTTFTLFDRGLTGTRANCGKVTVGTDDLFYFIKHNWNGDVDWNQKLEGAEHINRLRKESLT